VNGSDHLGQVLDLFILYLQGLLVLWAAYNAMRDRRTARGALVALVVACAIRAILPWIGIGATSHAVYTGGERITAFGQNANNSAMVLSAGLLALLGLAQQDGGWPRRLRVLALPLAGVIALAIVQTGSRGGLLALVAGGAVLVLGGRSAGERMRNIVLAASGAALLVLAVSRSDVMRNRLVDVAETGYMAGRERMYPELARMFAQRPAFGWGPINNKYELGARLWEQQRARRDSHNIVLEVLTATGVVAAVPFFAALALCGLAALRARRGPMLLLPLALLASLLTSNMSGNWIASKLFWVVLALALACGALVRESGGRQAEAAC
jgi:O-antigen ligase